MEKIGFKLQERRKEFKLSYKDISNLTKLPVATIKAIEEGNLDYFADDLGYVRFYVRSYCKAINLPYENFKDDLSDAVGEYSQTISLEVIKEHEKIEQNIIKKNAKREGQSDFDTLEKKQPRLAKKDRSSIMQNVQQSSRFRKAKHLDFAFLSLIVVIVIIVVLLIYVGVTSFLEVPNNETPTNNDKVSDNQTTPTPEENKKPNAEDDNKENSDSSKTNVVITQDTASNFIVSGIKSNDPIKMEITFTNAGSFNLWKGNVTVEGAYSNYAAGATYTYQGVVTNNELLTLNFWNFGGATIKINDEELKYDVATILPRDGVSYITITTKGE